MRENEIPIWNLIFSNEIPIGISLSIMKFHVEFHSSIPWKSAHFPEVPYQIIPEFLVNA